MLASTTSKPSRSRSAADRWRTAPRVATGMKHGVRNVPRGGGHRPGPGRPVRRLDRDGGLHAPLQEHGVAEGEEAVAPVQGGGVEVPPAVADEGVDQHEQAGPGDVEVGEQDVHLREPVAPADEEVGRPLGAAGRGPGLERAHDGRADGHDPLGRLHGGDGRGRDGVALAVDDVVLDVVGADRGEGAEPDLEVDGGQGDAPLPAPVEDARRSGAARPWVPPPSRGGRRTRSGSARDRPAAP